MSDSFTPEFETLFDSIPIKQRKRSLKQVRCPRCEKATKIIFHRGKVENDNLILIGVCDDCRGIVKAVIDNSGLLK